MLWGVRKFKLEGNVSLSLSLSHTHTQIFSVLGCYPAQIGNSMPTFWDNLLVPSSRVKQSNVRCVTSQKSEYLFYTATVASHYTCYTQLVDVGHLLETMCARSWSGCHKMTNIRACLYVKIV